MNSAPVCVAVLLALTAFAPSSSVSDSRTDNSSQATNATSIPTTLQTIIQSQNTTAIMRTTTNTENTTTVHLTSRSATTKSGKSIRTTITATTANNTSADITTAALPIVSHFDIGSFVGGIALALGAIAVFYFGRRVCITRSGTQYRTMVLNVENHPKVLQPSVITASKETLGGENLWNLAIPARSRSSE
ncbi:porimin isoform X2 [Scyliorhinus canicula]|uniref:porimin isoform X2 n=1 Tax=Scyliorhinus canicula TaxID=7830 RepID=UPI0018F52E9D|nr:porimin isoform X2 [Scyliorhinus canicula]